MTVTIRKSLHSMLTLLFILTATLAGCDVNGFHSTGGAVVTAPVNTISVYQMAGRLGLRVRKISARMATLGNDANTVVVFADPNGQAFVNGKPVGSSGGISPAGNILFLPVTLEPDIRLALKNGSPRKVVRRPLRKLGVVVLDPGHGGKDPGAIAITRHYEKDIVLNVALAAARILRAEGVDVRMTRTTDKFEELPARAAVANRASADLFVSIHANSAPNRSARGAEVFVAGAASSASKSAAKKILAEFVALGMRNRGVKTANFVVLVRTTGPAVLVETGFISNLTEARLLASSRFQQKLGRAIADGILLYLRQK